MGSSGVIGASGAGTPGALYMYQLLDTEGEELTSLTVGDILTVGVSGKWTGVAPATAAQLGSNLLGVMEWHAGSSSYLWTGGGGPPDDGAYTKILFIGPNDPATSTGWPGEENNHLWADTAP